MTLPTARPLLALDTSSQTARVAILDADGMVIARAEKVAARHSSNLLRLCDEVLAAAGISAAQLAAIACGAGPGSFTGLRVGLAVAKGLALPFSTPLVLVSSLEALATDLAAAAPAGGPDPLLVPCIDAGKEQVYGQLFRTSGDALVAIGGERALAPEALAAETRAASGDGPTAIFVGGNGADRYLERLQAVLGTAVKAGVPGPSAQAVGRLGLARLAAGKTDDLEAAVPSYGRPPDITQPKRRPGG